MTFIVPVSLAGQPRENHRHLASLLTRGALPLRLRGSGVERGRPAAGDLSVHRDRPGELGSVRDPELQVHVRKVHLDRANAIASASAIASPSLRASSQCGSAVAVDELRPRHRDSIGARWPRRAAQPCPSIGGGRRERIPGARSRSEGWLANGGQVSRVRAWLHRAGVIFVGLRGLEERPSDREHAALRDPEVCHSSRCP